MSDIDVDPRKLVAEVVGTFALIFIGAGAVIVTGATNLVGIAIAHGLAFALLISALGHISGGLFNPALTIGLWVTRQMDTINTIGYIIAQLVGAVLGAVALVLLFPKVMREASSLGTPFLNPGVSFAQGVGIEVILTMLLMIAVLGTAMDKRGPNLGGFGVGLVLTMGILAAFPLTGAAMNPARTFGPALVGGEWADHLAYWIGPIVGAVLAALLYQYVFSEEATQPALASVGATGVVEAALPPEAAVDDEPSDEPSEEPMAEEMAADEVAFDEGDAEEAAAEEVAFEETDAEEIAAEEPGAEEIDQSGESEPAGERDA